MTGIKDVAALAGVSAATVSRALSGNGHVSPRSRERVLAAAEELGFVMSYHASSLASGRNRNVGIIVPAVDRWFFGQMIDGASGALMEAGYDLTLYNTSNVAAHRESVFKDFLLRKRLDAVIAVSLELDADDVSRLLAVGRPVVGIGGPVPGVPTISVSGFEMAHLATGHLISLGHERIAHITGTEGDDRDFRVTGSRRDGYEAAMAEAGLEVRPQWVPDGAFTVEGGYARAKALLADPKGRPTAFFCASDEMAFGAILAARDLGLSVPQDVSVVGIDGHELSALFGLTTIDQHPRRQARRAVERLLDVLESGGAEGPHNEVLPTDFIVRSSTAVPRLPTRQGPARP